MVIPLRDDNPTSRVAVVTILLIALNVVIYLLQPHGGLEEQEFLYERAVVPCELTQGEPLTFLEANTGECLDQAETEGISPPIDPGKSIWLSVVTAMFLHGSILHLAGNMLFLWIFGNNIEDRLGPVLYVAFYLLTGAIATATHVAFDAGSTIPMIGASGAIAGVMGAYIVWFPHARIVSVVPLFVFLTMVNLPAIVVLGLWFVLQFATNPNEGVAWLAHVGGFVSGAALAAALAGTFGPPRESGVTRDRQPLCHPMPREGTRGRKVRHATPVIQPVPARSTEERPCPTSTPSPESATT